MSIDETIDLLYKLKNEIGGDKDVVFVVDGKCTAEVYELTGWQTEKDAYGTPFAVFEIY